MTLTQEQRGQLVNTLDKFLNAVRAERKPKDVNRFYTQVEMQLRMCWREQAVDLKKEWADAGIAHTFGGPHPGPTRTQIDALWVRAAQRGNERMIAVLDKVLPKALDKGGLSAVEDARASVRTQEAQARSVSVGNVTIKWDLDNPDATRFLRRRGAERVTGISKVSRDRIKGLVVKMADEGKSYSEIGKAIEAEVRSWASVGTGAVVSRGEMIAVTEVGEAYEQGRRIVMDNMRQAGLSVIKSWLAVDDERVCEICEAGAIDGEIPQNDMFSNGLDGPLGHPGCRCDMALAVEVD